MLNVTAGKLYLEEGEPLPDRLEPLLSCLEIQPQLSHPIRSKALAQHLLEITKILNKVISKELLLKEEHEMRSWLDTGLAIMMRCWLDASLPIIQWDELESTPDSLSIYLFCKPAKDAKTEDLFYNIVKKWLNPEKEIQLLSFQNIYFHFKEVSDDLLFVAELKVLIEDGRDLRAVQKNLPLLSKEIELALSSPKYAKYLLDTKALSYDQNGTSIHQELIRLMKRKPNQFDREIFTEMGRFLALSNREFRNFRPYRHITRLVTSHYLMHRKLSRELNLFPEKRHLDVRFIRTVLNFPFGSKPVLGVVVGVTLFDKYEFFEETHILSAVSQFIDGVHIVKDSFYAYQGYKDPIRLLYLELEKKDGMNFSLEEVSQLKLELQEELKKRIEKLIPSVFMIRNEEEIMKSILLLSQELKYLSDFPQVMISMDKQTPTDMFFTIVVVRLLKSSDYPLEKCFRKMAGFQFIPERVQTVGYLRKRTPKEANVFHLLVPKDSHVLRADSSVNFYLARKKVMQILQEALGEIRDFNGGMILKQGELFSQFKDAFKEVAEKNHELLENFFFSLNPIETQATLPLSSLQNLFNFYLEAIKADLPKRESCFWKLKREHNLSFAVIRARDPTIKEVLIEGLCLFDNFSKALIKTQVNYQGSIILGYIYETHDDHKQEVFSETIFKQIKEWTRRVRNQQTLKLSFLDLPSSLDPRLGGDVISGPIIKMLFDGLMRIDATGKPVFSVAKSVEISKDLKQYIFKLRESSWSNDSPLIAYDFEYAWKKILSPQFFTPFAYFFYPIKNAKAAKEGILSLNEVGITAVDESTLVIDLEHPTPEFLELVAQALYAPVNHRVDKIHPNWSQGQEDVYVSNGPFRLKSFTPSGGIELVKNFLYWDKDEVKLDRILISKSNANLANEMFKNDEIDWIGKPMRPWEPFFAQDSTEAVNAKPHGIHWCVFNTAGFPFHHLKMRQAFTYAINREELAKLHPYEVLPAASPLPLAHTQNYEPESIPGNQVLAAQLFEEALSELGLTRRDFPLITIIYTNEKTREIIAKILQEQFQRVLGIRCQIENYDFHILFNKMIQGDFQLGTMSWTPWINDPIYTLNAFKYHNNKVNFSKWENSQYQIFLDLAQQEIDPGKRQGFLKSAEKCLMIEVPVVPIIYDVFQYMQKKYVHNAFHAGGLSVDFKWASIVHDS